jgi:hypothetical protein
MAKLICGQRETDVAKLIRGERDRHDEANMPTFKLSLRKHDSDTLLCVFNTNLDGHVPITYTDDTVADSINVQFISPDHFLEPSKTSFFIIFSRCIVNKYLTAILSCHVAT